MTLGTNHEELHELRIVKRVDDHTSKFLSESRTIGLQILQGALKYNLASSSDATLEIGPLAFKSWRSLAFLLKFNFHEGLVDLFQYV